MTTAELLAKLKGEISPAERAALKDDAISPISRHNRETLLRMLSAAPPPGEVDPAEADALRGALTDYLDRYMPGDPAAHKWIILACLFLSFVVREPMHPQAVTGWDADYRCPAREEGGICRWCVCR